MSTVFSVESEWLGALSKRQPKAAELLSRNPEEQQRLGYFHTLREICQQPATWLQTSALMLASAAKLQSKLHGTSSVTLTGSGSSEYAGDCVRSVLQGELGLIAQAIGGGILLSQGGRSLPPGRPGLLVSLARSGDSPESVGALAYILETEPEIRHLVFTCNQNGSLARTYRSDPRVTVVTLDDVTNDRSLVMTSSFTNLVLAARSLGLVGRPEHYESICTQLSQIGSRFLNDHFGAVAEAATAPFQRAVFLASGSRFGGTREASLKMLEMTSGRVTTMCETYLSFRHGPMAYVNDETLVVCCLSSDSMLRAYESDLIRELDEKKLGLAKILIGENVPKELARDGDTVLECPGLRALGDENFPVIDVLAGQLLAFFRCRQEGLRPDSPSEDGVISRVVRSFTLHSPKS